MIFRGLEARMDWGLIAQWVVILGWVTAFVVIVHEVWR
jgi:hypothetical protein